MAVEGGCGQGEPVRTGEEVRIVGVEGVTLRVRRH